MIRSWLSRFMVGRYGPDQLFFALFIFSVVLGLLANIAILWFLVYAGYAVLIYGMFRFLSKNITKRRAENDRFLRIWWPVKNKLKRAAERFKARKNYRFFKCPACKNVLRVPKGKGKIQVTCPKCGERFIKKT